MREFPHPQPLSRGEKGAYYELACPPAELKATIYAHPEFAAFIADMNFHFENWKRKSAASLRGLGVGSHPKDVISALAENLLEHYTDKPLIDRYDIYQHLMDYWAGTMQDDCYLIAADGWKAETSRIVETDKKGKEKDKGWACDLIHKPLIVARYYGKEQAEIDALTAELEGVTARLAELEEEHGGEKGSRCLPNNLNVDACGSTTVRSCAYERSFPNMSGVMISWKTVPTTVSSFVF